MDIKRRTLADRLEEISTILKDQPDKTIKLNVLAMKLNLSPKYIQDRLLPLFLEVYPDVFFDYRESKIMMD